MYQSSDYLVLCSLQKLQGEETKAASPAGSGCWKPWEVETFQTHWSFLMPVVEPAAPKEELPERKLQAQGRDQTPWFGIVGLFFTHLQQAPFCQLLLQAGQEELLLDRGIWIWACWVFMFVFCISDSNWKFRSRL